MASIERPMIGGLSSLVRNHFAAVNILFDTDLSHIRVANIGQPRSFRKFCRMLLYRLPGWVITLTLREKKPGTFR